MRVPTLFAILLSSTSFIGASAAKHHFTLLSDLHYDPNYGTPKAYGNGCTTPDAPRMGQSGCDSPLLMVESTFADIAANAPNDSYLVFTGDWLRHGIALDEAAETFKNLTQFVKNLPHSTIPAPSFGIASLGNNDFIPDYFFNVTDTETSTVGMYGSLLREANLINDAENATFARAAYYARELPIPKLRFLVLNTLPYSTNLEPSIDPIAIPDPVGQFAWMEAELADAEAKGTSVVLTSHIAPTMNAHNCVMGSTQQSFIKGEYLATLQRIVTKYKRTIVYQFYGHSHQLSFLGDVRFGVPGLIVPSVTKIFGNTASYLMCEYDDETRRFSNFTMRHLDQDEETWSTFVSGNGEIYLDNEIGAMSTMDEINATATALLTNLSLWERYTVVHAGGVAANMWPGMNEDDGTVRLRHTCSIIAFAVEDYAACLISYGHLTNAPTSAAPVPDDGQNKKRTLTAGIIALIVSAGLIGVGGLMFMYSYSKKHLHDASIEAKTASSSNPGEPLMKNDAVQIE